MILAGAVGAAGVTGAAGAAGAAILAQSSTGLETAILGPAGLLVAFFVGTVSFFTPCILPLLPGYLAYTSGVGGEELEAGHARRRVVGAIALFVLGFSLVFTALGATASALGGFLLDRFGLINRIAGAIVIVMGLAFLSGLALRRFHTWQDSENAAVAAAGRAGARVAGVFMKERALEAKPRAGLAGALPLGAAFAVGWTPCVGPGLATILTLAATEGSAARGAALLFSFSIGFGVWFLLGGLAFRRVAAASERLRRHMGKLTAAGGVFLLAIGVLLVTNQWERLLAPLRRLIVNFTPPV